MIARFYKYRDEPSKEACETISKHKLDNAQH